MSVIRVVLLKEGTGSGWVAQCLQFDIAAQGPSIKTAIENFRDVFQGQVELDLQKKREPLAGKKQAPPWYWQALKDAEPLRNAVALKIANGSRPGLRSTSAEAWVH